MTMARLIGMYTTIPLYVLCIAFSYPVLGENEPVIQNVTAEGAFGKEAIITCTLTQNSTAEWLFEGKPVVLGPRISQTVTTQPSGRKDDDGTVFNNTVIVLKILSTTEQDAGNYTCSTNSAQQSVILDLSFKASLVRDLDPIYKFNLTSGKQELKLTCAFEVYNQTKVEWILRRAGQNDTELSGTSTRDKTNIKLLTGSYHTMLAASSFDEQNGTYICQVWDSASQKNISSQTDVMLYNTPVLDMQTAVAIKSSAIYFNWTVKTFNSKIKRYHLSVKNNSSDFTLSTKYVIDVSNTSFVMDGLEKNTKYNVLLAVNTEHGTSKQVTFAQDVTTLSEDPVFVPNISINGVTSKSMTIALSKPPPEVAPFVHYYLMETWKRDGSPNKSIHETVRYLPEGNVYMFNNLEPHSKYVFRAKACSDYTKQCGNWSEQMNADTLDGTPDRPTAVRVECPAEDGRSYMNLTWQPPAKPNAEIKGYMVSLDGAPDRPTAVRVECPAEDGRSYMNLTWQPPAKPNAEIKGYMVSLDGAPDRPTAVRVECPAEDGRSYMNLTWQPPAKPNAEIKGYMVSLDGAPDRPTAVRVECPAEDGRSYMNLTWQPPAKPNAEIKGYMVSLDGAPDRPTAVRVECPAEDGRSYMNLTWQPPAKPNAEIKGYMVSLDGAPDRPTAVRVECPAEDGRSYMNLTWQPPAKPNAEIKGYMVSLDGAPDRPTAVRVECPAEDGRSYMNLTWQPPAKPNAEIKGYMVSLDGAPDRPTAVRVECPAEDGRSYMNLTWQPPAKPNAEIKGYMVSLDGAPDRPTAVRVECPAEDGRSYMNLTWQPPAKPNAEIKGYMVSLDGAPDRPTAVRVECPAEDGRSYMNLTWQPPAKPNAEIKGYMVSLDGAPDRPTAVRVECPAEDGRSYMNLTWQPPAKPNAEIKGYMVSLDGAPDRPTAVRVECPAEDGRSYMNLTWQPPAKPNAEIKGYMVSLDGAPDRPTAVRVECPAEDGRSYMNLTWQPPAKPNAEIKGYMVSLDGAPDRPTAVRVECPAEDGRSYMNLTWQPPAKPNAEIKGYMMELTGNSTYVDRYGVWKTDTWGPLSKFMTNVSRSVRVDDLKPNTKYTVRLSAMTRMRRRGLEEIAYCSTKPAAPDVAPRPRWRKTAEKVGEDIKYTLRVLVPRSSERNGPICCYRVYVVRLLPGLGWSKLPPPQGLPVLTYADAHAPRPELCAYATDVFNNENFPPSELTLGDGRSLSLPPGNGSCTRCYLRPRRDASPDPTTADPDPDDARRRRGADSSSDLDDEFLRYKRGAESEEVIQVFDGQLDTLSNYSVFVELIPGVDDAEPLYSGYTVALNTANPPVIIASNAMELTLQICCAVAALMLLGTIIFCVVHTRRTRKPRHAHVELNPIQAALRYVVGHIGGRQQLATVPPDMPPIAIEDLAAAYAERQADSDYGFQKEFELLQMLPECYPDRTTHASEARENQPKNRYPDIKAYDQTRVKLTPVDGVPGSDYINANYVMGYKEHKQFICAQGPTDTTVNDFWRMIWEHDLELIVMLTNLEEYSKVKCSKYWPDEIRGSRAFGSVTVHHVSEKRYSDYIVRELRITKQPTNSEGQPIVENGVAKRNGDCKDAESGSAPTSPREAKDASRTVRQYHFLMWKDFAAPEHPQSILRFIKRVNEAWSSLLGRPVVVHCSAGVGRTGTLVALDVLLEQLAATRRASVLAAVAELRRQRNFLVQSLKQYVFVYRALVEYAHYGDTEIPASRLKTSIDRLRNTPAGADKCLMEHEFQKMMNPPVAEPVKSCAAGVTDEARARNRSPDILPYDRNRVILTPAPPAAHCTYINASFIEAYDNTEGYIITQDPLPNTIVDFWRMCSEHNVSTIVMLSELGEGKCPRYWDDGTAQYEHISVQYEESESCPYYTRRQFRVTNNKSGDVSSIRQLQYHGWPTAPGHLPEVTRGLGELGDAARTPAPPPGATTLFHCQYGTERSALFAALCILIAQLRTERRVDVAATARKVRSQRARTIDTFLQYEFLHRAILNYAELHNLLEDS